MILVINVIRADFSGTEYVEGYQHNFERYLQTYHTPFLEMISMLYDKIIKTVH